MDDGVLMLGRLPATLTELFLGYAALGSAGAISLSGPSRGALKRPRRHGKSSLYGTAARVRRALSDPFRRVSARAVHRPCLPET